MCVDLKKLVSGPVFLVSQQFKVYIFFFFSTSYPIEIIEILLSLFPILLLYNSPPVPDLYSMTGTISTEAAMDL